MGTFLIFFSKLKDNLTRQNVTLRHRFDSFFFFYYASTGIRWPQDRGAPLGLGFVIISLYGYSSILTYSFLSLAALSFSLSLSITLSHYFFPSIEGNGVIKNCQLALERGRKLISTTQCDVL